LNLLGEWHPTQCSRNRPKLAIFYPITVGQLAGYGKIWENLGVDHKEVSEFDEVFNELYLEAVEGKREEPQQAH